VEFLIINSHHPRLYQQNKEYKKIRYILLLLNECCPHRSQSPILTALASERWILTILTTFILPQFLHHIFVDLYWVGSFISQDLLESILTLTPFQTTHFLTPNVFLTFAFWACFCSVIDWVKFVRICLKVNSSDNSMRMTINGICTCITGPVFLDLELQVGPGDYWWC
jgi:hypothetical protein